jgi:hypothetical protein
MVIAIPAPLVVEGHKKQVGVFKILQNILSGSRGAEERGQWKVGS